MQRDRADKSDSNVLYNAHIEELINGDEKDPNDKSKYYDWAKTLSYDADVTMVVGARGVGKTYGLRKQVVKDYIKHGWRFVEICRHKNEVSSMAEGYFSRIDANHEYPEYMFKTTPQRAYIAKVPNDDYIVKTNSKGETRTEKVKVQWEVFGYFVALSDHQALKKRTFHKIRRIIFDEAVLDKRDKYHHYLPSEYMLISNIVDTVSRERADDIDSLAPRVYLLGNALDLFNPYFEHYGITSTPKRGYSWHKSKTMLLDYVESREYSAEKLKGTVAGRMIAGTIEGEIEANNEFLSLGLEFIKKKSAKAEYVYAIYYGGNTYAIWVDNREGLYYVCRKVPKKSSRPTFTLTASDARINYIMAKRADKPMQMLAEAFYLGIMRFEDAGLMNGFLEVMTMFGVKR